MLNLESHKKALKGTNRLVGAISSAAAVIPQNEIQSFTKTITN
jgi:hypothetical protein